MRMKERSKSGADGVKAMAPDDGGVGMGDEVGKSNTRRSHP